MSSPPAPRTRADFPIAIICALVEEANAVQNMFDQFWSDDGKRYGKVMGDPNAYTLGVIGRHNVVLVHLGEMGNVAASVAAANLKLSFPGIKLALVVGICGVVPFYEDGHSKLQIWLGDIIISTAVVHYDFGRQYPGRFVRKSALEDSLARASREIRPLVSQLRTRLYRDKISRDIAMYLESIQATEQKARYPGSTLDKLYRASYLHKHHEMITQCKNCKEEDDPCPQDCYYLKCDDVIRQRNMSCENCRVGGVDGVLASQACVEGNIGDGNNSTVVYPQVTLQDLHPPKLSHSHHPSIHFGRFGSANKVMKSGEDRDALAQAEDIIALEMEAVGVWELFPTVVIKSACDYADSHKNKDWQKYATMTAAACMRSVLDEWDGSDLCEFEDINRAESRPSHRLGQTAGHTTDDYRSRTIATLERTRLNQPYNIRPGELHFASNGANQSRGHHRNGYEPYVGNVNDRPSTFGSHDESDESNIRPTKSDPRSNRPKRGHGEADGTTVSVIKDTLSWDGG